MPDSESNLSNFLQIRSYAFYFVPAESGKHCQLALQVDKTFTDLKSMHVIHKCAFNGTLISSRMEAKFQCIWILQELYRANLLIRTVPMDVRPVVANSTPHTSNRPDESCSPFTRYTGTCDIFLTPCQVLFKFNNAMRWI